MIRFLFSVSVDLLTNSGWARLNLQVLLGYGFCIEGNEHDYVALKPNFTRDPNAAAKKQILEKCNLLNDEEENSDRELVFYVTRKGIPDDLLAVFRVLVMNEIETTHYLSVDQREYLDFIGYRNEYAMVETLHKLLTSKLLKLKNAELNLNAVNEWQKSAMYYRTGMYFCRSLYTIFSSF